MVDENLLKLKPRYPFNCAFIGCGKPEGYRYGENKKVWKKVEEYLESVNMKVFEVDESGKRIWNKVVDGIILTPFGIYIAGSYNRNVHIEIGYSLAKDKPVFIIVKEKNHKVDIASDIADLFQIRYKNMNQLEKQIRDKIRPRFFSPYERLRMFLESATPLHKYLIAYLLEYGPARLADIVTDMRRVIHCDNPDVTDFVKDFKEFLDIAIEGEFKGIPAGIGDKQFIKIYGDYEEEMRKQEELKSYIAEQRLFKNLKFTELSINKVKLIKG